jgi:hypothetical protein
MRESRFSIKCLFFQKQAICIKKLFLSEKGQGIAKDRNKIGYLFSNFIFCYLKLKELLGLFLVKLEIFNNPVINICRVSAKASVPLNRN